MSDTLAVKLIISTIVGTILGMLFIMSYTPVASGTVGIHKRFRKISNNPLKEGVHFIIPFFDSVETVNTQLISYQVEDMASSFDMQNIKTQISIQHALNGEVAPETIRSVGNIDKIDTTIVSPAILDSFKAVTAKYTAEQLITKRAEVKTSIEEQIKNFIRHTLKEKGLTENTIHIANVSIQDLEFSNEFNASIEAKVKAQQDALRAANEKQKRITEAEASAKEIELSADAQAYQIEQNSIARAAAIEREAKALAQSPNLIQLRAIEKWNGQVPVYSGGQQPIPFINVGTK